MKATEKLKEILLAKGYNINSFSKKFNMPYTTVKNVVERGVENTTVKTVLEICVALNISIEDLLMMTDTNYSRDERALIDVYRDLTTTSKQIILSLAQMEQRHARADEFAKQPIKILQKTRQEVDNEIRLTLSKKPDKEKSKLFKVYTQSAAAGYGNYVDDSDFDMVAVPCIPRDAEFGVRISGDSMEPQIFDRDIVFVKRQPAVDIGQVGIFILDGEAYCKQLAFANNKYFLRSFNPEYSNIPLTTQSIYTVGLVLDRYSPGG